MKESQIDAELTARRLALIVLNRVERDRAWAETVLNHELERTRLCVRERGLATKLVYGCLAWRGYLDWQIATLCTTAPSKLETEVRQLLRLGLYQILKLDRVPGYAAVSTTVSLAKATAPRAAGLVNAVLRRALREKDNLTLPAATTDLCRSLSVRFSHPVWLVRMWLDQLPSIGASQPGELEDLLAANNQAAPTALRACGVTREELIGRLAAAGITARAGSYAPQGVVIEGSVDLPAVINSAGGRVVIQGEASQLVAHLADPRPGDRILDACAGPGGKATHLARLGGPQSTVLALDIHPRAADRVKELAQKLGLPNLHALVGDARRATETLRGQSFSKVLVDAPCSGLGTLRSHPELRWTRSLSDIETLANLQLEILRAIAPLVCAGGSIVYSTCTLAQAENEDVVAAFTKDYPAFEVEDPRLHLPAEAHSLVTADNELRTLPHRHGLDGFFAVRLGRQS